MSLINNMLRNLEQRHAASAPLPNEVRPLPPEAPGVPWNPIAAAVILVGAAASFVVLRDGVPPSPSPQPASPGAAPVASMPPAPAPPLAALPAPPQTPLPAEPAPAIVALPPITAKDSTPPPASAPPRVERAPVKETLQLATSLPSLERAKPKTSEPAASVAAPVVEKASPTPEPAVQAEADLRRARELLAQGKRAEAEPLFKQGLAHLPGQTDAAVTLARLQVDRADVAAAWETLQKSLPYAQQQAGYRAFCGTVLQRLNRSREAVEHYQAALRVNAAEGRWWVGLGLALEGAGQAAEAREAFQRARTSGNLSPEMAAFAEQKSR